MPYKIDVDAVGKYIEYLKKFKRIWSGTWQTLTRI